MNEDNMSALHGHNAIANMVQFYAATLQELGDQLQQAQATIAELRAELEKARESKEREP